MGKAKRKRPDIRAFLRKHPLWSFDDAIMSEIDDRIGATLFSFRAMTAARAQILSSPHWLDPKATRRGNKERFKEQGGVDFQFRRFICEMTISALANAIESTEILIHKISGAKFDIWKPGRFRSTNSTTAKKVLCLNNVIKHNRGLLDRRTSQHAKFLVDECGMIDGYDIYLFEFDFEALIRNVFFYLHDRGSATCDARRTPRWAVESLYRKTLPNFLPYCAPMPKTKSKMPKFHLRPTGDAGGRSRR